MSRLFNFDYLILSYVKDAHRTLQPGIFELEADNTDWLCMPHDAGASPRRNQMG